MKPRKPRRWIERLPVRSIGVLLPSHDYTFDPEKYLAEVGQQYVGKVRVSVHGQDAFETYAYIV